MRPERALSLWLYAIGLLTLAHAAVEYVTFDHETTGTVLALVGLFWVGVGSYRLVVDGGETWPESHGIWTYAAAASLVVYTALVAYLVLV